MFDRIRAFFATHKPTSAEALIVAQEAIKLLQPAEIAKLKAIVAELRVIVDAIKPLL